MSEQGLSIRQAIAQLAPDTDMEEEQRGDDAGAPDETLPADASPAGDGSEAEPGDTETQQDEDDAAAFEPPRWWSREAKDRFAELPRELQAVVFAQEETRERVVSRAKQDAAEARRKVGAQVAELDGRIAALDAVLPQALQTFRGRWESVDWAQAAQQMEPADYNRVRAQFEQEQGMLKNLLAENQRAEAERIAAFDHHEAERLKTVAPELADEKLGPSRKAAIAKDLIARGFEPARIRMMNAEEASYVNDALKWREAQASMTRPRASQASHNQPQRPVVRPTAANGSPASSKSAALRAAQTAFNQSPTRANAIALELLKNQG